MNLEEFEKLAPEAQEEVFHKSSFKEKADLILRAHKPDALTRSLSQEELYLLTRELDIEERSEVIRYATLPQLFFISDIDCWKKDRLDRKNFVQWLETLIEADEKKLFAWLMEMDYEAVVAGFHQLIQVMKPDHEWTPDDVLGDTPYFTLDQMYYIFVSEENFATVRRAVEILFENHRGRYVAILEGLLSELENELEEEAYIRREARLCDRGFPDFESAQKIYRPLSPEEYEKFPLKNLQKKHEPAEKDTLMPNYTVLWSQERFFLDDVLHSFHEDRTGVREGLQEELAWISNKVIACDGIDFSSEDKVRRGIERARGFINIGLELLSGEDLNKARKILEERWMEIIFRWGVTQVLAVKDLARALIRDYWKGAQVDCLNFLNEPYDHILAGLLRITPAYYDSAAPGTEPMRHFKSAADLERSRRAVEELLRAHELVCKSLKKQYEKARKETLGDENSLTLFSFLGTLFAAWALSGKIDYVSLSPDQAGDFFAKAFEKREDRRFLKAESKENFLKALDEKDSDIPRIVFALFFDRLEEEFQDLKDSEVLQPEFVSMVRFESKKTQTKKFSKRPKSSAKKKN